MRIDWTDVVKQVLVFLTFLVFIGILAGYGWCVLHYPVVTAKVVLLVIAAIVALALLSIVLFVAHGLVEYLWDEISEWRYNRWITKNRVK